MAEQTSDNVSGLVLLTEFVTTQEHNLRKCQFLWHKINKFLAGWKSSRAFEDAICHYLHVLIRNIKYTINLTGDLAVCYVPISIIKL